MAAWDQWLTSLADPNSKSNIDKNKSGIFTRTGAPCAAGKQCGLKVAELAPIVNAIKTEDFSVGCFIGGKKFQPIRKYDQNTLILKAGADGVCVSIGLQFAVLAMPLEKCSVNDTIAQVVKITESLHAKK